MFDLNAAIESWCREVLDHDCANTTDIEELIDHLHCLVEEQRAHTDSDQAAFVAAIRQMGDSDRIRAAYSTNASLLKKIAAHDKALQNRLTRRFSGNQLLLFAVLYSFGCAALIVVLSALVDPAYQQTVTWTILALWIVPTMLASTSARARQAERSLFRRLWSR